MNHLDSLRISPEEIQAVIDTQDTVVRNLKITLGYHELTAALWDLVCDRNVTWPAFATYASKTAGKFIRNDEVPFVVRRFLNEVSPAGQKPFPRLVIDASRGRGNAAKRRPVPPAPPLTRALLRFALLLVRIGRPLRGEKPLSQTAIVDFIIDTIQEVSDQIMEGNLKVFSELAPLYAEAIVMMRANPEFNEGRIDQFVGEKLKPGAAEDGGQDLLKVAFKELYLARYEQDKVKKAQMLLASNARTGLHEQTRLQDNIVGSLDAPVTEALEDIVKGEIGALMPRPLRRRLQRVVDGAASPIVAEIEHEWREIATKLMMTLPTPDEVLDLGDDVTSLSDGRQFPEELTELSYPDLITILKRYDRTWNTLQGSAASDWGSLDDRMNFIVDLFRSRQQDDALVNNPFTTDQADKIHAGEMPAGKL